MTKQSATLIASQLARQAAVSAERLISAVRLVFCSALLVRFFMLDGIRTWQSCASELAALSIGIVYSIGVLVAIHRGQINSYTLHASVVLEAVICFVSLVQTTLWPSPLPYRGILARPDAMAMLVVVFCAGYRLSTALALTSGILNFAALGVLVTIERARYASTLVYGWEDVLLFGIVLGCAVTFGIAIARRTSLLVASGALASSRIERARADLTHLMRDQHDARSLLNAALLQAGLIGRAAQESPATQTSRLRTLAGRLCDDLSLAGQYLQTLGERAYGQLAGLHEPSLVDAEITIRSCIAVARLRFPALQFELRCESHASVLFAGGGPSLERVLFNLIANAAEGDGSRGASEIWVSVEPGPTRSQVRLEIRDNGPGFHQSVLSTAAISPLSTKLRGAGLGLVGVRSIVSQSGGTLQISNAKRGALVTLTLPVAAYR
jgi:signal transduction histidine kinase